MDKASLVVPDIEEGRRLLRALERAGLSIAIAGWLKLKDRSDSGFFVASPDVQRHGPRAVNTFIDRIRLAINSNISMDSIWAANTTNHFINDVPLLPRSSATDATGPIYRLRDRYLSDVEIEDGVIYKIDKNVKPSKEAPRASADVLRKAKRLAA